MHLIRCQDQKQQTLEEFYAEIAENDRVLREGAEGMLSLIERLRELPAKSQV